MNEYTTKHEHDEESLVNLPSRAATHSKKKLNARLRFSQRWFQCLLASFVIIILILITYPYWSSLVESPQLREDPVSYIEEISIE
ncbi:hypothetical protein [Halobacillus sp. A5]|uniref:hypothetical protein n=1 Tax=Halobacillus sp. A5 TaxID=2880263 RepID=UPI0020A65609|nr:hypothetical protein [Halobacillus sp. A5]MCP3025826.1 hypothetical protein [Halobacillus sp. A5]